MRCYGECCLELGGAKQPGKKGTSDAKSQTPDICWRRKRKQEPPDTRQPHHIHKHLNFSSTPAKNLENLIILSLTLSVGAV